MQELMNINALMIYLHLVIVILIRYNAGVNDIFGDLVIVILIRYKCKSYDIWWFGNCDSDKI